MPPSRGAQDKDVRDPAVSTSLVPVGEISRIATRAAAKRDLNWCVYSLRKSLKKHNRDQHPSRFVEPLQTRSRCKACPQGYEEREPAAENESISNLIHAFCGLLRTHVLVVWLFSNCMTGFRGFDSRGPGFQMWP